MWVGAKTSERKKSFLLHPFYVKAVRAVCI